MKVFGSSIQQKEDSFFQFRNFSLPFSPNHIKLVSILFCFVFLPVNSSHAQDSFSLQLNGGIIYPLDSERGFSSTLQLNYRVSSSLSFYIYSGYAGWYRNKVTFRDYDYWVDHSIPYQGKSFDSYSDDNHTLIPVYIGSTLNFNTGKLLTPFLSLEVGYSYLSYYSYEQTRIVSSETGWAVNYIPDLSTKKFNSENLFGVGIGGGLILPVAESINLILAFKLNSYVNSHYYGLFSTRGTYTALTAGFNYYF